ncbi:MAG: nucleoside 2-deoxyribosyltransferase [Candidatus Obscuribacterales bacterium]|nr:nucleoside 2-deoxyribosyltransferase [Candidatus Obscuribacterales bacterium]
MSSIYITHEVVEMSDLMPMAPQPDWRTLAISKLQKYGLRIVNPIDWAMPTSVEIDNVEKRVRRALDLIDQCDAVLANLHRSNYGTAMEIFYAHRRGKMVTVVGPAPFSPWVLTHSQKRFSDLSPALDFLIEESLQTDILNWALQFESGLSSHYEEYPPAGEQDFQFFGGELPILVLAPHASTYFRDGEFLEPDFFTGAMASSLHRSTRCHSAVSTYCSPADPCFYTQTPLVRAVADIVKSGQVGLVLIVLGLNWHEASAVLLEGMGPDRVETEELLSRLRSKLSNLDQVGLREPADDVKTLMKFISQTMSVPVISMRVHRRFRMPRLQPEAFMQMNNAISQFIIETGTELVRSAS